MESFEYNPASPRVIFGRGTISKLPNELSRQNLSAPLLLTTPGRIALAEELKDLLNGRIAGIFSEAAMHTPAHITEAALAYAKVKNADSVVSIGGGSTVGLGKAISIYAGLPHICIPTTYSGSEMTAILGETKDGKKTTRSDSKIMPGTVIYDVDLTLTLPPSTSATSGVNAIAHAVEALYARNSNPIVSLMALEGIKSLAHSLPILISAPSDVPSREKALYGAFLCASTLGSVSMGLHHKLCHTLGGSFGLPHAETHTIILPHALAYNAPAVPNAMTKIAAVLPGSDGDAIKGLNKLLEALEVKRALKDFGFKEEDIGRAAEIAVEKAYDNPRPVEERLLREILRRAWAGEEAKADL